MILIEDIINLMFWQIWPYLDLPPARDLAEKVPRGERGEVLPARRRAVPGRPAAHLRGANEQI